MNRFDFGYKDPRMRELIALRMDSDLLTKLKQESVKRECDLSNTIRTLVQEALV